MRSINDCYLLMTRDKLTAELVEGLMTKGAVEGDWNTGAAMLDVAGVIGTTGVVACCCPAIVVP